jgi:lipid-A-disaccharide synthase
MPKYDIIIVANSPGELSALVKPVAETLYRKISDARIILVLTPCQYTSGKEMEYIKSIRGISEVVPAKGYTNWILRNRKPKIKFREKGIVIYLGGDLAHAILVAKKVKYPAFAYVQERLGWSGSYKKFFVPDVKTKAKFKNLKRKIKIVGDLMVDSVGHIKKWTPKNNVITFLPGSRHWQINHTTPIYKKIIEHIRIEMPKAIFQQVSSPFVKAKPIDGVKMIDLDDVHNSELVITIPGTNTARLAAMGIPMISVFPLDNPDAIPMDGLPHYIGKIPYIGSKFKRVLVDTLNKKIKYFALPNMKAKREIVPEIRGIIYPATVAMKAISLLEDPERRKVMSEELKKTMGRPGAAIKIAEEINEALHQTA